MKKIFGRALSLQIMITMPYYVLSTMPVLGQAANSLPVKPNNKGYRKSKQKKWKEEV